MSTPEICVAHGLPRDIMSLTIKIQQVLHDVGKKSISNIMQYEYTQRYAHRFIQRVNREEEEVEGKKPKMRTGMIKSSGLSHTRE